VASISGLYLTCHYIFAAGVILHTLHDIVKQLDFPDLLYVTIQIYVVLNICNIAESFLSDGTLEQ
jgi:hypothetical protein